MANMFLNKRKIVTFADLFELIDIILVGVAVFYFCISLYLFGDLAIYGTAVPKSIRDIIWFVDFNQ